LHFSFVGFSDVEIVDFCRFGSRTELTLASDARTFALTRLKGQAPKPRGFVVDTAEALTRADRHTAQNFQENRNGGHLYGTTLSSEKEQEPIQYP
jgi:hypothetical protein